METRPIVTMRISFSTYCSQKAIFALVFFTAILAYGSAEPLPRPPTFLVSESENTFSKGRLFYRSLHLDESSSTLYIGAMNTLYKVWMYNINDTSNKAFFMEKDLQPSSEALSKCAYRTRDHEFQCQNHVRVVARIPGNKLYVCGTNALTPLATKLDASTLEQQESPIYANAICPVDPNDNATAVWVEDGNPGGIPSIYSATDTDFSKTSRIIYRPALLDDRGDQKYPFMRTMHTDSKWLNDPQFIGSFNIGAYVYFFYREFAVEHINCGKAIYSRVSRVCKNDVGGQNVLKQNWATFLKVRLNCSLPGEFPFYFDEIQDVVKILDGDDSIFYATFTTSLHGFYGSAICAFSLRDINAAFDRGTFKEQANSASAWLPVLASQIPHPRPGQCVEDTKRISDTALHFIKSHPLMDGSVTGKTNTNGDAPEPLFYKRDIVLSKLQVDSVKAAGGKQLYTIFAGTVTGEVYKILHWFDTDGTPKGSPVAVYKLPNGEPIRALQILPQEYIYIAQDTGVVQLQLGQCFRYKLCTTCASDPYCSWNSMRQQCDRAHESHQYSAGWIRLNGDQPLRPQCVHKEKRVSKLLYPGDSVHLGCLSSATSSDDQTASRVSRLYWLKDGKQLDTSAGRILLTVDRGLVITNVSVDDSGRYECMEEGQVNVIYNLVVDTVNCQKPHNVQAFQSVYRDWCREFQEYKHTMYKWKQWYEENLQCAGSNIKKLPTMKDFDNKSLPAKSNRLLNSER